MKIFKPILASLFLLFVVSSTSLFSMDSSSSTSTTTSSSAGSELPASIREVAVFPSQATLSEKQKYQRYFEQMPAQLKEVVKSLKMSHACQQYVDGQEYVLIFVGPASAGKTEGCKAIAHYLGWPYIGHSAASLGTTYQNSAVQNMKASIVPLIESGINCVVFLDEITALTKGSEANSDDQVRSTRDTEAYKNSCELNTLLDRLRKNKHVLFIGTTNDQDLLTNPIQQRSKIIQLQRSEDASWSKFTEELSVDGTQIRSDAHEFISNAKDRIKKLTFREVEKLIKAIKRICWTRMDYAPDSLLVNKDDIEVALNEVEQEIAISNGSLDKKSEQRQIHDESMALQRALHQHSMRVNVAQFKAQHATREVTPYSLPVSTLNRVIGRATQEVNDFERLAGEIPGRDNSNAHNASGVFGSLLNLAASIFSPRVAQEELSQVEISSLNSANNSRLSSDIG